MKLNLKKKLKRREAWKIHRGRECLCEGTHEMEECFRPGGQACRRRAKRKGVVFMKEEEE